MLLTLLKSKIHRATVTGADLDYEGSISIDPALCDAAGLLEFERVEIYDCNNGARLATYVLRGKPGEVCLNGAAARLVHPGDPVIIASYVEMTPQEAASHKPTVVLVDRQNRALLDSGFRRNDETIRLAPNDFSLR
ncbi:MAG: aspartate 1-decarboxylase [Elusimicrobiota bacterium]|jgi:aspartate 1-decarboxylase